MADNNEQTVRELNALIETNLDAVLVLEDALDGLQSPELRDSVQAMHIEHRDAALRLQDHIRTVHGGEPATAPHATNPLKESWQQIWEGGGDKEVLLALRANERVAVDGFQLNLGKESVVQTMTEEGRREHQTALETELRHFQTLTDHLRTMGVAVDNDEVMGAVRNAAEHIHAAINLSGTAIEAFIKWATGAKSDAKQHEGFPNRDAVDDSSSTSF